MPTTITANVITQEPENYRGTLVYTQEYGYKTLTMIVSVVPYEQSYVTSHTHNIPFAKEAEYLQEVDFYHFAVTDNPQIQLIIETPTSSKEAWFSIERDDVIGQHSPFKQF